MATIYRFIVENRTSTKGSGRTSSSGMSKKATAKKGRWVSVIGGEKGGVEHNRKLRAINPLLNRATGGWWEKGMRLGRAGLGLVQRNTETGKIGISGTAIAIIIAFAIQMLMKWNAQQMEKGRRMNEQNFKSLENGVGAVHGAYNVSVDLWTGKRTYNENK